VAYKGYFSDSEEAKMTKLHSKWLFLLGSGADADSCTVAAKAHPCVHPSV